MASEYHGKTSLLGKCVYEYVYRAKRMKGRQCSIHGSGFFFLLALCSFTNTPAADSENSTLFRRF